MKRFLLLLLSLLTSCSAQFVNGGSNTGIPNLNPGWTYVQTLTNTVSCASTTCQTDTLIPTVAGSVWIVITTNASNISPSSVSLGGGTWVHCTPCHGYTSGLFATDIYYNLSGTTGTTAIDVNYATAPSTTSFVEFIEISPPSGYTASFDTGGYNASTTCTTTCTGATLTLTGNDAIVMPTDYLTNWNGWNFITGGTDDPWFADWTGDGLCLNCTVGTAPSATVGSAPAGWVGAEIAFKSTAGTIPAPTPVFSFANITAPYVVGTGNTPYNCSPTCTVTIPSTTAGNLLFVEASTEVLNDYISSISGGGTWVVPTTGCQEQITTPATLNISCAYTLSATGSTTSLSITMAGSSSATGIVVYEVHRTSGAWTLDTDGATANTASFYPDLQPLTLSGTNDVVFQAMGDTGGINGCQFYPYYVFNQPLATDTSSFALLNTAGVPSTPVCYNPQDSATVVHGVAFK
jgi:hypothetical protein